MNLLEMLMGNSQAGEGFSDFLNRFEDGPLRKAAKTTKSWTVVERWPARHLRMSHTRPNLLRSDL